MPFLDSLGDIILELLTNKVDSADNLASILVGNVASFSGVCVSFLSSLSSWWIGTLQSMTDAIF